MKDRITVEEERQWRGEAMKGSLLYVFTMQSYGLAVDL
jgi:hypothetical protein